MNARLYQPGLQERVRDDGRKILALMIKTERAWCIANGIVDVWFRVETTSKP